MLPSHLSASLAATAILLAGSFDAAAAKGRTRALGEGTWELSGQTALTAGNGTAFDLDAAVGYFFMQGQEAGVATGLHLDGLRQLSLGPFYRYHFLGLGPNVIPYVGGGTEFVYTYVPAGGRPGATAQHEGSFNFEGAGGFKLFGHSHWALLVELALRLEDVGGANDFLLAITAGFAVYL